MQEDIHFLVNELEGELHEKIQDILQDIQSDSTNKNKVVLEKFTRAVIRAAAQRLPKPQPVIKERSREFEELKKLERQPFRQRQPQKIAQPYYAPIPIPQPPQRLQQFRVLQQPPAPSPWAQQQPVREQSPIIPQQAPQAPPAALTPLQPPAPSEKLPEIPPVQKLPTDETLIMPSILPPKEPTQSIVPQSIEQPLALIVDAEARRPVVTALIQNDGYTVNEPSLSPEETQMLTWLRKKFLGHEKKLAKKKKLNKKIYKAAKKMKWVMEKNDEDEYLKMKYYLVKHLLQASWVEPLLHDENITKIMCEGENTPLMIMRGGKMLKTNVSFPTAEHINSMLKRFAEKAKKIKLTEKNPAIDVMYGGFHIEGTIKTVVTPAKFTMEKV